MSSEDLENEVFYKTKGNFVIYEDHEDGVLIVYNPNTLGEKTYSGRTKESVYKKMLKDLG